MLRVNHKPTKLTSCVFGGDEFGRILVNIYSKRQTCLQAHLFIRKCSLLYSAEVQSCHYCTMCVERFSYCRGVRCEGSV